MINEIIPQLIDIFINQGDVAIGTFGSIYAIEGISATRKPDGGPLFSDSRIAEKRKKE